MDDPYSFRIGKAIYIMGVSGSGKSTVGLALSQRTGIPFYDGDDFHPKANIEKMAAGQALDDEDRRGWLLAIRAFAAKKLEEGRSVIIACSALKASYRLLLAEGISHPVYWIYLKGSFDLIKKRITNRKGHFMPAALLPSQFDALEPPEGATVVDISRALPEIVDRIIQETGLLP